MTPAVQPGRLDAVLFDLDGTLADSMTSIAVALAETLGEQGHRTSPEELMPHFGPDMRWVIRRATGVDEAEAERLYRIYLPNYYERYMPGHAAAARRRRAARGPRAHGCRSASSPRSSRRARAR